MNRKFISFITLFCLGSASLWANLVLFWNDQVLNATRLSRNPPPIASLHLATYHAAIFDAVNGFDRAYEPWLVDEVAPAGADRDAAHRLSRLHRAASYLGQRGQPTCPSQGL